MPELPEVEITRRGIVSLEGMQVTAVVVRNSHLRWPVPRNLPSALSGNVVRRILRRAKYLLLDADRGWLIIHLGMSGSLRIVDKDEPAGAHDHVDIVFGDQSLRLRDPRRFGSVLWTTGNIDHHALLTHLGVEPLSRVFSGETLYQASRGRSISVKQLLMDHKVVVGVGNIYANESLFRARIHPRTAAGRITRQRYERLASEVKHTMEQAIEAGGSSLRDFVHSDGARGYFQQQYFVYGRSNTPCRNCGRIVKTVRLGQRSTFYCPNCQR
jgi:formamidopyrimidine-DNA glycosylase